MSNNLLLKENSSGNVNKYLVLALLFLGWCIGNVDRNAISFVVPALAKEFDLSASQIGLIMSSFFAGYALMQLPGGYLADRYGSRKVLLVIVFCWSIFTGLTGAAWSLSSLIAFRFMFGLSEGTFMPTGTKMIAQVFPRNVQGKAFSILLLSSPIVATLFPIIFATFITNLGWRSLFYIIGSFGFVIIILYYMFLKASMFSTDNTKTNSSGEQKSGIFKEILKVPMLWSLFLAGFCATAVIWGLNAWIPTYLMKVRGLNLMQIGWWQMFPSFVSVVAMLLSGYVADKLSTENLRRTTIILAVVMAVSIYLMCSTTVLFMFFLYEGLALASVSFIMLVAPKLVMKRFSPDVVGSSMGFVNLGSQIGSFTAPLIMGFLVDLNNGSFNQAFWYLVACSAVCAIAYLTIATNKIQSPSEDTKAAV